MDPDNIFSSFQPLGDNAKTDTEAKFTLFPNLARELRDMIWVRALPGPRFIKLYKPFGGKTQSIICHAKPIPSGLFQACAESRMIALSRYSVAFAKTSGRFVETLNTTMYVDWERDVLQFVGNEWRMFWFAPEANVLSNTYLETASWWEWTRAFVPNFFRGSADDDIRNLYGQQDFEASIRHLACSSNPFEYSRTIARVLRNMPDVEDLTICGVAADKEALVREDIELKFGKMNKGKLPEFIFLR